MKFFKVMVFGILLVAGFFSCQKELKFDGGSVGAFKKDANGNCLPIIVNGIFKADTTLATNVNYVDVELIATIAGSFQISSDTVNGYSFYKAGNLGTGSNIVRLYAIGKPLVAGNDMFTIRYGNSTCRFTVTVVGTGTTAAVYTLNTGLGGTCSGAVVNGTYTQGVALTAANSVTLQVNVTQIGTYTMGAASVNGMIFSAAGVFTTTGLQAVTLSANGLPLVAGIFNATASNITSSCTFSITVLPPASGAAIYTLNGAPGSCTGFTQNGTYTVGTALNLSNTMTLNVTVATIGTYSISSTNVNGISFAANGNFTATGPQIVTLQGSGTPLAAGNFNFTATAGLSNCIFSVVCVNAAPVVNLDYIPETTGTNFSIKLLGGTAADTFYYKVSPNTIVKGTNTYRIFVQLLNGAPVDSMFNRKNAGLYYRYYKYSYGYDSPLNMDALLLDSNLSINATWSTNIVGNTIGGMPATGAIAGKILDKGATAVIAGNTYNNVIKVLYTFSYNVGAGAVDYYQEEFWYAKGKGVIYEKDSDIPVSFTDIYETTRIEVL